MQSSARLKTVQDLLAIFLSDSTAPLDVLARKHFRTNRYIGSKDRRAIQETLYHIIRTYLALKWKLEMAGAKATARLLVLLHLQETGAWDDALFAGEKYGLDALEEEEQSLLGKLKENNETPPEWARLNCPEGLYPAFQERFGDRTEEELAALGCRAPFTVRLNTLKKQGKTAETLTELGFQPVKFSPLGYSSEVPVALQDHALIREGRIEVQDEGSQLAMLLAGAEAGMQVLDLCAGGGGKTLGLAAEMKGRGQIYAADTGERRLKELQIRCQRAGARNVQTLVLPGFEAGTARKVVVEPFTEKMDRVVLDVPCSGTGTWRRSPDNRFRLTPDKLAGYIKIQKKLLVEGAEMVRPGGWLVYITCSLLKSEGEGRIEDFLEGNKGWRTLDYREILENRGLNDIPESASTLKDCLLLTPARHGSDGFFVSVLEKS